MLCIDTQVPQSFYILPRATVTGSARLTCGLCFFSRIFYCCQFVFMVCVLSCLHLIAKSNRSATSTMYEYGRRCRVVWLNGRAFARDPKGRGFESRPVRFPVTPWASCSNACASVAKQYNLVPADGRWRSSAGQVTAGLAESNGSLPPGGWLQVTCGLTVCIPGSAPGPTIGNEYGRLRVANCK